MAYKLVAEDGEEIVLRDGFSPVPSGSGWFGFSSSIASIEQYGLTVDDYERMLAEQHESCGICDRHPTSVGPLVVDHDHESGRVRGLLCRRCNLGLGLFYDTPDIADAAADWLRQRGCWRTKPLSPEVVERLAPFTTPPDQIAIRRTENAIRGWTPELRHVFDCRRGTKDASLDEAWERFWIKFRTATHNYKHRERALFKARDEWIKLGGDPDDFRTP